MNENELSRRNVLVTAGAAGIGLLAAQASPAQAQDKAGSTAAKTDKAQLQAEKRNFVQAVERQWRYAGTHGSGAAAAAYLNLAPAQGPGEALVSTRSDGTVDVWIYL